VRRGDADLVIEPLAKQCAGQRRVHADVTGRAIKFVGTDNAMADFVARLVFEGHVGAKEYALRIGGRSINHHHTLETLAQETHPTIDLAQALFAVGVFGIFGAIALRRGLADRLRHLRPLDAPQLLEFGRQPVMPLRGDELGARRRGWSIARHATAKDTRACRNG